MTELRPLLVSYQDIYGGAARATYRLHVGLQKEGIASRILAANKTSDDPTVSLPWLYRSSLRRRAALKLEMLPRRFYSERGAPPTPWSTNLLPTLGGGAFNHHDANLIHLHWIGSGIVPIPTLAKIRKPLLWTLHDMWGITGGCHYAADCTRYFDACGACPQLASTNDLDLSRVILRAKQKHWQSLKFTVVSPSRWLADCARKSTLFRSKRIEVIPNGLDTDIYRPMAKEAVRVELGLPQHSKLILFGALNSTSEPRKGYQLLLPALHRLAQAMTQDARLANLALVVVGADGPATNASPGDAPPIPIHYAGYVTNEEKIAALYAAADLFVAPSLEDNLPNTVMEALACGVPSVAFNVGGMPDMIEHQANGYLATPFEVEDLAKGMAWILADDQQRARLGERARAKVMAEFTLSHSARQYQTLYTQLLAEHHASNRMKN